MFDFRNFQIFWQNQLKDFKNEQGHWQKSARTTFQILLKKI